MSRNKPTELEIAMAEAVDFRKAYAGWLSGLGELPKPISHPQYDRLAMAALKLREQRDAARIDYGRAKAANLRMADAFLAARQAEKEGE